MRIRTPAPSAQLVIIWGDPGIRNWKVFDASAAIGRNLCAGWHTSSWLEGNVEYGHLLAIERD